MDFHTRAHRRSRLGLSAPDVLERPLASVRDGHELLFMTLPSAGDAGDLFFRTNDSFGWRPATADQVKHLLGSRTANDPWVTVTRPASPENDPDGISNYFQVLGTGPDALLVEGGGTSAVRSWYWTSTWQPIDAAPVTVGPRWYRYTIHASEVQTVSDAVAQLWPALTDISGNQLAPPGYLWRHRNLDS